MIKMIFSSKSLTHSMWNDGGSTTERPMTFDNGIPGGLGEENRSRCVVECFLLAPFKKMIAHAIQGEPKPSSLPRSEWKHILHHRHEGAKPAQVESTGDEEHVAVRRFLRKSVLLPVQPVDKRTLQ